MKSFRNRSFSSPALGGVDGFAAVSDDFADCAFVAITAVANANAAVAVNLMRLGFMTVFQRPG